MKLNLLNRITINSQQCGGRPCVRGMRIRVSDVLNLLANNLTVEQILDEIKYWMKCQILKQKIFLLVCNLQL